MMSVTQPEASLDGLVSAIAVTRFEIGSDFYAMATQIIDPHNFYVVPMRCMYHLPALNKAQEQCSLEELHVYQTVIYRSHALKRDVRGLIVDISEDMSKIYALDHGIVEVDINVDRIFHPLHRETETTPPLARHCELDLCFPKGDDFSHDAIHAFKFYMGNQILKVSVRGNLDGKLRVTIYNSCPDDIATILATAGYTSYANYKTYTTNFTEPVHRPLTTFQHRKIKVGQSFIVKIQSEENLSLFYVMPTSLYNSYIDTRKDFDSYCTALGEICPENFIVGAPIGVKEHSSWPYERAIILEVIEPESKAKVKLVDCGYTIVAPMSRIKCITAKVFTDIPVYSLYCSVNPLNASMGPDFISEGNVIKITVEGEGLGFEKPHIVSISNL